MPKLGMQSIRRRQLIDATLEAINEVGMHDATIAQIARRAGVSTGIISHYFRDICRSVPRAAIIRQSARQGRSPLPVPVGAVTRGEIRSPDSTISGGY